MSRYEIEGGVGNILGLEVEDGVCFVEGDDRADRVGRWGSKVRLEEVTKGDGGGVCPSWCGGECAGV